MDLALDLSSEGNFGMKAVCETLGVARSNIAARAANSPSRARGRPSLPDRELVEAIKAIIADMPIYGYRRVHAILRRNARKDGRCGQCKARLPGHEAAQSGVGAPHRSGR